MFDFERMIRIATAAAGAIVLSTLSVAAAVGPGQSAQAASIVYAQAGAGVVVHG